MLLLLLLLLHPPSKCAIEVKPVVALAPLRYIRIKVILEEYPVRASLTLLDAGGEITSSEPRGNVRTEWIEWKNVSLGEGEYVVTLQVSNGCSATARISVN
jgi:hypothetical protein